MTIEQNARAILDICERGPIPGGISIEIREQAQAIVDAMAWKDADQTSPSHENHVWVKLRNGEIDTAICSSWVGWIGEDEDNPIVEWREQL